MILIPHHARQRLVIGVGIALFLLITTYFHRTSWDLSSLYQLGPSQRPTNDGTNAFQQDQIKFWRAFHHLLVSKAPPCKPLVHPEDSELSISFDATKEIARPNLLQMTPEDVERMRRAHEDFVQSIRIGGYDLVYQENTRGIVTTAGGAYLPVFVISLRMLRRTGSTLPVEVFLADHGEYDVDICDHVLPGMNAKCLVLSDIFSATPQSNVQRYQYKILSIILSSFSDVLFLDSDCYPIFDPEFLFDTEPYTSTGMVTWPDFWYPSESPHYFRIANIEPPPLNTRASCESGELLYSKPRHSLSLLLAAYYNIFGPDYYYPLQSQGAPGEGDKETFPWAATMMKEPFYHVRHPVSALGYFDQAGEFQGSAMCQYDPAMDYAVTQASRTPNSSSSSSSTKSDQPVNPLFVHANYPKFDPATIFRASAMGARGVTRDKDGHFRRVWMAESDAINFFGFDLEARLWEEVKWTACELEHNFTAWAGLDYVCRDATEYWTVVFAARGSLA